jgi:glycine cleavage system transcriptional repressor
VRLVPLQRKEVSMPTIALVSILGPDRIGLVAAIADHLYAAGINLRDVSFAALGTGAEFTAVCELPEDVSTDALEGDLAKLSDLDRSQVRVVPYQFDPNPALTSRVTHRITISGGDQLGLVARLAEIFRQYRANIVRLEARKLSEAEGGLYVTRFAVSVAPEEEALCLAAVSNTAGALGLSSEIVGTEF